MKKLMLQMGLLVLTLLLLGACTKQEDDIAPTDHEKEQEEQVL